MEKRVYQINKQLKQTYENIIEKYGPRNEILSTTELLCNFFGQFQLTRRKQQTQKYEKLLRRKFMRMKK